MHPGNSKLSKGVRSVDLGLKMEVYKNFTILLLLILGVSGQSESENHTPEHENIPKGYVFGYDVSDMHTGDIKSQWEKKEGDVVIGSYSLVESDGSVRTVDYKADGKSGFNAVVKHSNLPQHNSSSSHTEQLIEMDDHPINADLPKKLALQAQPLKTDYTIFPGQYEEKSEFNELSPIAQKQLEENEKIRKPSFSIVHFPFDLSLLEQKQNETTIDNNKVVVENYLNSNQNDQVYPWYQYLGERLTKMTSLTEFSENPYKQESHISPSGSNEESEIKFSSDPENQYEIMDEKPYRPPKTLVLFEPHHKLPLDLSKLNTMEMILNPDQQKNSQDFPPGTSYQFQQNHITKTTPDFSARPKYPSKNYYAPDKYTNNLLPYIIKKHLGGHQQKPVVMRLRLRPKNREFVKYAKTITYVQDDLKK